MHGRVVAAALSSLLLATSLASAQPKAAKAPPAPAATTPAPPAAIVVNDPLLTPVPPPPRMLTSWREALGFITSRSIDVATSYQEVLRAEALRRQALAATLGTITATGRITGQVIAPTPAIVTLPSGNTVNVSAPNPTVYGEVNATFPVLAPRAWYAVGTADMSVTSSRLTYDDKRRTVLTTVANAIVAVITAERVVDINRNGLKSALERLDLTQRKFRLGDATRLDVLRAEQDASTARATLVSGDESLRQARESLGLALGFHEAFGVPPSISLADIEATIGGVCAAGKVEDRADIRKQKNDLEIAKRGITDAWLAFSPTVQLGTTVSASNNPNTQPSGQTGAWSVLGLLTIPLWDGGLRYAQMRVARVQVEEAKLTLEATMRTATVQVGQALRSVAVAEQSRAVSTASRDLARESSRLAQRAYEVGTGTSFDLVNTAQQERAAELDLAVKEFNVISARLSAMLAAATCTY